ncbi:MAG: hypothetical protein KDE53_25565, partial [Caldilineaceae bacterium]|nr:hypothetical protein [Caldilineaceae bacterium]
ENAAWQKGIEAAQRWLGLSDLNEECHRLLMRLFAASGQSEAAKAQYEYCRQRLWDELGVETEPETVDLYQKILAGNQPVRNTTQVHNTSQQAFAVGRQQRWGEAPSLRAFVGRTAESAQLAHWLTQQRVNLIAILGIGGQGKTSLAAHVTRAHAEALGSVYWRSLINAPPLETVLDDYLHFLAQEQMSPNNGVAAKIASIHRHLRQGRHLLVLDNLETILDPARAGHFRAGYEDYQAVLHLYSSGGHPSTLIVTSREAPLLLTRMKAVNQVALMTLSGLSAEESAHMLALQGVAAERETVATLTHRYSGNPLALQLVIQTIEEFYFGNVTAFLDEETLLFEDIRHVLDRQFERLTPLEEEILLWLAITREATDPSTLKTVMLEPLSRAQILDAMMNLQRRSLIERDRLGFTLQNVVMEYATARLVKIAVAELQRGALDLLHRVPLIQVQVKEYVHQSQLRVILGPVAAQLAANPGLARIGPHMQLLLDALRQEGCRMPNYAPGTILNLLLYLKVKVDGFDFSNLAIRQVEMRNRNLANVNMAHASLADCAFTSTFGRVEAVAISPNGQWLAIGGDDGDIRIYDLATNQPLSILS